MRTNTPICLQGELLIWPLTAVLYHSPRQPVHSTPQDSMEALDCWILIRCGPKSWPAHPAQVERKARAVSGLLCKAQYLLTSADQQEDT